MRRPITSVGIVAAMPAITRPMTNNTTAAVSGFRGLERSDQAPAATMPITLVASVPENATAYRAAPLSSSLTIGITVVTASDCIAARKISATAPIVTVP